MCVRLAQEKKTAGGEAGGSVRRDTASSGSGLNFVLAQQAETSKYPFGKTYVRGEHERVCGVLR